MFSFFGSLDFNLTHERGEKKIEICKNEFLIELEVMIMHTSHSSTKPEPMRPLRPEDWNIYVRPGARIFVDGNAATPNTLVKHFLQNAKELIDIEMVHILTMGECAWMQPEYRDRIRTNALFLDPRSRIGVSEGRADYTPCFLSEIPSLFYDGILALDVALIQVTPPDEHGYCSFGVSVDIAPAACRSARYVVAQVNPNMPRTLGQSFIHVTDIDAYLECNDPIPELPAHEMDDVTLKIGQYVASLIEDGATLQMGIGKIPDAVLRNLTDHRDLGVHTEMFSDGILSLMKSGVINNSQKTIHRGKTITSFCMGSRHLYDFIHNNPHIEFHASEYVNRPTTIAQNKKMVAINSCIEVDLTGQVVSDSVGRLFYSGIGGQVDFIRGAAMSPGGRPIIALQSTAKGGTVSKILPCITRGSGVVTSRGDVHFVVTEYGVATLRGRSIRERALELIQIAHPKFRDSLLKEVREYFWVPAYQAKKPTVVHELGQVEFIKLKLKDKKDYVLRPLKPSDERRLQEFFYSHTRETLWQRYRNVPKMMSRETAYKLVNVEQSRDLALCIVERQGVREIICAVGRYYLDTSDNTAEVGFVVDESKRGLGMANALMASMIEVAKKQKISALKGIMLANNWVMQRVFEKHGFTHQATADPNELLLTLDLSSARK